ncbi:MAG: hypothetical protein J5861_05195 [Desulfovibrio sp.]|nr:hypothetical protein [Desulfovibrio sp.]
MTSSLLIALPWLHKSMPCTTGPRWNGVLRLWPGLPDPPGEGWLCPDDYPFSPREAAACAADLNLMGETALSGLPLEATFPSHASAVNIASEKAMLESLGATDGNVEAARRAEVARRDVLERQQAQKVLLWVWQQEERLEEIATLASRFAKTTEGLATAMGSESDENTQGFACEALTDDFVSLNTPLTLDEKLFPSWRTVVENVLCFIPQDAVIALEGAMLEEVTELLNYSPAPRWERFLDTMEQVTTLEAKAPGWKLLGRTRPTGKFWLDAERLWIGWRHAA